MAKKSLNPPKKKSRANGSAPESSGGEILDLIHDLGGAILKYGAICFCCYCMVLAAQAFAGKETKAQFLLEGLAEADRIVLTAATVFSSAAWYRERKLRKKSTTRLEDECDKLRNRFDLEDQKREGRHVTEKEP